MIHELKIRREYFDDVESGRKPFEVRRNDRDYHKGDYLLLYEIGMFPVDGMQRRPTFFMRNYGERMLCRGGSWFDRDAASMFELYMREDRKWIAQDIGFRAAWVDLD